MENIPTLPTSHSVNSHFVNVDKLCGNCRTGKKPIIVLHHTNLSCHTTAVHAWCSIHPQRLQITVILTFLNSPVHSLVFGAVNSLSIVYSLLNSYYTIPCLLMLRITLTPHHYKYIQLATKCRYAIRST